MESETEKKLGTAGAFDPPEPGIKHFTCGVLKIKGGRKTLPMPSRMDISRTVHTK